MKKKKYSRITAVIITITAALMIGAVGKNIVSAAERRQIFIPRSYGRFIYDDNDASNNNGHEHDLLIDASDFTDIAENMNSLTGITDELAETTVRKNDVIDTIEEIKDNTEKDKVVGANAVKEFIQAFQDGVNKIYDKLAGLGFTPKTNSPDDINNAIQDMYDSRYAQGYTDGLGETQSANAKITYIYHEHTGSSADYGGCYTVLITGENRVGCSGTISYNSGPHGPDTSGNMYWAGVCTVCGFHDTAYSPGTDHCPNGRSEPYSYYTLGCGMGTNTIIGAVIDFEY